MKIINAANNPAVIARPQEAAGSKTYRFNEIFFGPGSSESPIKLSLSYTGNAVTLLRATHEHETVNVTVDITDDQYSRLNSLNSSETMRALDIFYEADVAHSYQQAADGVEREYNAKQHLVAAFEDSVDQHPSNYPKFMTKAEYVHEINQYYDALDDVSFHACSEQDIDNAYEGYAKQKRRESIAT
jgi:tRNA A37 N6-isopentenylltransferase MiaA